MALFSPSFYLFCPNVSLFCPCLSLFFIGQLVKFSFSWSHYTHNYWDLGRAFLCSKTYNFLYLGINSSFKIFIKKNPIYGRHWMWQSMRIEAPIPFFFFSVREFFLEGVQKTFVLGGPFSKHQPSGPMLSISRNVRLCVCPSDCLFVCLFTFEVPFNGLFAPTSQNRMSNIFRDLESLGKSYGKKWSNIWTFWFGSGAKKKFFLLLILPYKTWWKPRFPMD